MVAAGDACQARSETLIMATPGGAIQLFCDPVATTSRPHPSVSNGTAPRPLMASTRSSVSGDAARIAALISASGLIDAGRGLVVGHQDRPGRPAGAGHGAQCLGNVVRIGCLAPLDVEPFDVRAVGPRRSCAKRSPNEPMLTDRTSSAGR